MTCQWCDMPECDCTPTLRRRVAQLVDALEDYGTHKPRCRLHQAPVLPARWCDCGLYAALWDTECIHELDEREPTRQDESL